MTPKRVREIRKKHNLTQEELAGLLGVHAVTVSNWESGKFKVRGSATSLLAALRDLSPTHSIKERLHEAGRLSALALLLTATGQAPK